MHSPCVDMGAPIDFRFKCKQQGLCSPAKEPPARGKTKFAERILIGLRWCPRSQIAARASRPEQGHLI